MEDLVYRVTAAYSTCAGIELIMALDHLLTVWDHVFALQQITSLSPVLLIALRRLLENYKNPFYLYTVG